MVTIKFGFSETDIDDDLFVQLYANSLSKEFPEVSYIGNSIIHDIQRLGIKVPDLYFDFLTIALSVTAADTFVNRETLAADSWFREFTIKVPVCLPNVWNAQKKQLEKALNFLTGDNWHFEFLSGGKSCPKFNKNKRFKVNNLELVDCVSLFSGGMDSAIGAVDFLTQNIKPLFISHGYKGDAQKQRNIGTVLKNKYPCFEHFNLNANPRNKFPKMKNDITMRGRSFNFLAFAVVGAGAILERQKRKETLDLLVPENGVISLNAPLTKRRIGSLSTRTTHPYFLEQVQILFDSVGINVKIKNPYQFKTKGEMTAECRDKELLNKIIDETVSCSHWKRNNKKEFNGNKQCGVCVPCLIRRSACFKGGVNTLSGGFINTDLNYIKKVGEKRDDLFAVMEACYRLPDADIKKWIRSSGPLPADSETRDKFASLFERGIKELETFLQHEGVIN